MAWKKMTKNSVLKRQQAESMFAEGFGPHKVSKSLKVNFHTVRAWQTAFIAKRECRNQGNTLINRTLAMNLFSCGYGYRTVSRILRLSSIWLSRDWARQHRKLSIMQARKNKRSKK